MHVVSRFGGAEVVGLQHAISTVGGLESLTLNPVTVGIFFPCNSIPFQSKPSSHVHVVFHGKTKTQQDYHGASAGLLRTLD